MLSPTPSPLPFSGLHLLPQTLFLFQGQVGEGEATLGGQAFHLSEPTGKAGVCLAQCVLCVDALYDQIYHELLLFMIQDPKTIQRATYLLWVAHDLERVADRATNVAERVLYLVTGKMTELNVSNY